MRLNWTIFVNAKTEDKALKLMARILKPIGTEGFLQTIEPYPKTNGYKVEFCTETENQEWKDIVFETFSVAQKVGYGWGLSGRIREELSLTTNRTSISGIVLVEVTVYKSVEKTPNVKFMENEAERLANCFHDFYEELAPKHGYETREDSRVEWENVPQNNKSLMIAVCQRLIDEGIVAVSFDKNGEFSE